MTPNDKVLVAAAILVAGVITFGVSLPLIYRKVPMNHFYGIRIRQAFASAERWYDINERGGRLFARWSLLLMLTGIVGFLLPPNLATAYTFAAVVLVLISVLVPLYQIVRWSRSTSSI